jgi:two-component system NtrC family sensor kinase
MPSTSSMFDETQGLVAWNSRFQQLLEVPDGILAERPTFARYVRYLADRGELGTGADLAAQLRRLADNAGQHYAYERTRPDGRVIEVRHNPV